MAEEEVVDLAGALEAAAARAYEQGSRGRWGGRAQPIPSDLDPDSCRRRQVLEIVEPGAKAPLPRHVLERFEAGDRAERDVVDWLSDSCRLEVLERQVPFGLHHRKTGAKVVSGRIDGVLRFEVPRTRAVLEVKLVSTWEFDRLERYEDLPDRWWTRRWVSQLQLYLVGRGLEHGLLVLTDGRRRKALQVPLDLEAAERAWQFAEEVVDAVGLYHKAEREGAASLPAFTDDKQQCARCPFFGRACNPPGLEAGAEVVDDEVLEREIGRWRELEESWREREQLDRRIKTALRYGIPKEKDALRRRLVGPYMVEVVGRAVKAEKEPRPARVDLVVSIEKAGETRE